MKVLVLIHNHFDRVKEEGVQRVIVIISEFFVHLELSDAFLVIEEHARLFIQYNCFFVSLLFSTDLDTSCVRHTLGHSIVLIHHLE